MIVAFMKPLVAGKKNGSTIPITMTNPASARFHQDGRRFAANSCHSRSRARSSLMSSLPLALSGLPRLLTEQPARAQGHDRDQVAEYHCFGPLRAQPRIGERLD